ncbi:hypothetical protein C8J56DRAFT_1171158 [Mycena floridula]|nr:hypothetical protein C8J56DRAFT_1171158 [Mycena floridula]
MSSFHVFSLPPELLQSLTPRNLISRPEPQRRSPSPELQPANSNSGARTCTICLGSSFPDVEEQRNHFRSDWHRYNVKTKLNGGNAVNEADFGEFIDGLEDSLSGSASSSDSDDSDESDAVATLVNRQKRVARSPSLDTASRNLPQTALAWFHSPPSTQIGIYRALFPTGTTESSYLSVVNDMQTRLEEGRTWAMFMVAGGHFAGAIVQVSRPEETEEEPQSKKKPKRPKADTEVLKHKTFHRYTTRRKQGGSQGLNDNAKGNAKSAGAQLRRYGEQSLRDDIRNLLSEWAEEIDGCERIWIRASGQNRKIFVDYEGCVIPKGDDRLRTYPFPTRRPTQSELGRCLLELTRVKQSHLTEDALRAQDEAYLASLPKPKAIPTVVAPEPEKPKAPKLSKEEEALREKWARLLDMIMKGRLEPLKSFWEREGTNIGGIDVSIPVWAGEKHTNLLQVAVHTGQEAVTKWLLEEAHADPTIEVVFPRVGEEEEDNEGTGFSKTTRRTAYDLARVREVRDVFRRCAADHPDWWDWFGAGHVPSGLTQEQEEERDEKKKIRRKGLKDRVKEREAREREKEPEKPIPAPEPEMRRKEPVDPSAPRKLGGATRASEGVAGLTPEMRAKVERERRARAAEARLKGSG